MLASDVGMLVSERRRSLLHTIVLPALLAAAGAGSLAALGGCHFDASGLGGTTIELGDGSSTTTQPPSTTTSLDSTSTSTSPASDSGPPITSDDTTTGDPSTGEVTSTSDGTGSTTGPVGCMVDADCQLHWVCEAPECINPDEGMGCLSAANCGPAAPICSYDLHCYDGSDGDPCNIDAHCVAPLVCGSGYTCQDGDEGDPCAGPTDCGAAAPYCPYDGMCHDGSDADPCYDAQCADPLVCGATGLCQDGNEGDPCLGPGDCGAAAPFCPGDFMCHDGSEDDPCGGDDHCVDPLVCGPFNVCQDGAEGDSCFGDADCGPTAPYCPYDGYCHDGSMGDPWYSDLQCAGALVCLIGSNTCGV